MLSWRLKLNEQNVVLLLKKRDKIPSMLEKTAPVVICTYRRLDRLGSTLSQLIMQTDCTVEVLIWNNNPEGRELIDATIKLYPKLKVTVHHSGHNIGGFGRFYFARRISSRYSFVIFIDDDVILNNNAISTLIKEFEPRTIRSFHAFKFKTKEDYFYRQRLKAGEEADYCGTGGAICDTTIFKEKELFQCPKKYWFIEDLWLSYYASHVLGWKLYKSKAEIKLIEDGKNQWVELKNLKTEFLQHLVRQGWDVVNGTYGLHERILDAPVRYSEKVLGRIKYLLKIRMPF